MPSLDDLLGEARSEFRIGSDPGLAEPSIGLLGHRKQGRRFESARGLCKSPANRWLFGRDDLQKLQCAVGMEPFMELSGPRTTGDNDTFGLNPVQ
jgi:hypothetical protein